MKIPMPMKAKKTRGTDLTALEMRSPAVASIVSKMLPAERTHRLGKTSKERVDEWLEKYRNLPDPPTLDDLKRLYRECPVTSLPEAGELLRRIQDAEAGDDPPPAGNINIPVPRVR